MSLRYKKRTLYSYFEKVKPELSEEDKKVIGTLYSCLSKERQEGIEGYIEGRYHQTDVIGKRASSDIRQLQSKFEKFLKPKTLSLRYKKRTLYSYFEKIKPELSEEDKKVIGTLYSRLSKERQEGIEGYLEGRYHQRDEIGRKASNAIRQLQEQFKRYLEIENSERCSREKAGLKRKQVLLEALKVIELSFYRLGYTSLDYQKYKNEKMIEILNRGNNSQLKILHIFVVESFYFIKEQEKIRTL